MTEVSEKYPPAVELENLGVTFRAGMKRRIRAVDNVHLKIPKGDIFGLLGPNGAGKSTVMYCLLGLVQPDQGRVSVGGQSVHPGADLFENVAYLPEEPHYHPYLSVEEAVSFYASLYRRHIPHSTVLDALHYMELENYRRLRIAKCSKGMKQKVGLAACMLFEPEIMCLDEPTRGLDPVMVRKFRDYLMSLNKKGTTIIINSHVLSEVELICNRVAIMNKGGILADDLLSNLIRTEEGVYEVVLESDGRELPDFVAEVNSRHRFTAGKVAEKDLEALIRYCREEQIKLQSCRALTETLEDVFMRLLGESDHVQDASGQHPE